MKPQHARTTAVCLLSICSLSPNLAAAQDTKAVVQRFERTYRPARTLRASFLERYFEGGKELRAEAGTAYFSRPGKMRWEYESPERNLYVIDGKWSWFYVPADHTVTRIRARESSDWRTPLALLAGEMKVSRICAQVSADFKTRPSEPANTLLRCAVRGSGSGQRDSAADAGPNAAADDVLFEVNSSNGELSRILIIDPGGIQVEFRFSGWNFNPPLNADLFHFETPKGVAIVNGDLANEAPSSLGKKRKWPRNAPVIPMPGSYHPGNGQPFLPSLHIFQLR